MLVVGGSGGECCPGGCGGGNKGRQSVDVVEERSHDFEGALYLPELGARGPLGPASDS